MVDPAEPNPNEEMVVLRVDGERFEVSEAALKRCGSESMLVQAVAHEGEQPGSSPEHNGSEPTSCWLHPSP